MRKPLHSISFLASLALLCGVMSWGALLNAQQTSSDAQQSPTQPQESPTQTQRTPDTQAPPASQQAPDQAGQATPNQGGETSADPAQGQGAAGEQTFTGTVVQKGDKYVLQSENGTTYNIDHQDQVKKFEGKRVRVQGILDPTDNTIRIK